MAPVGSTEYRPPRLFTPSLVPRPYGIVLRVGSSKCSAAMSKMTESENPGERVPVGHREPDFCVGCGLWPSGIRPVNEYVPIHLAGYILVSGAEQPTGLRVEFLQIRDTLGARVFDQAAKCDGDLLRGEFQKRR